MNSDTFRTAATFILIGLIVVCLGALAGWYFVLRANNKATAAADAARGYGQDVPSANINGSTFQNSNGSSGNDSGGSVGGANGSASGNVTGFGNATGGNGNLGSGHLGQNGNSNTANNTTGNNSGGVGSSTDQTINEPASPGTPVKPQTPRLWHASKTPVAGFGFGSASSSTMYYAERLGGYVFRANIFTGEILRLSNTLKPKTYEARFFRFGATVLRTVNEKTESIESFSGKVSSSTSASPGTLLGNDLKHNITDIATTPDAATLFYILPQDQGTAGFTSLSDGSKEKRIFTSPIGSWKPILLADGRTIIVQKPHDSTLGYSYEIKKDGTWNPLERGVLGLTILPVENSSTILYGASTNSGPSLYLKTSGSATAQLLPIKTTADKCVWAPYPLKVPRGSPAPTLVAYCAVPDQVTSNFLQKWYRGELHTADSWWRIDGKTGETKQVMTISKQDATIDVIDPQIDPSGEFISFKNNTDASLWVLRITP